jgi:hypothetical protein
LAEFHLGSLFLSSALPLRTPRGALPIMNSIIIALTVHVVRISKHADFRLMNPT